MPEGDEGRTDTKEIQMKTTEDEFQKSLTKYSNRLAPEGQVYVCGACGKQSQDKWGYKAISYGWDENCMAWAVLCFQEKGPEGEWVAVDG